MMKSIKLAVLAAISVLCLAAGASAASATTTETYAGEFNAEGYYGKVYCKVRHQTNSKKFTGSRDVESCKSLEAGGLIGLEGGEHRGAGEWFPGASGWSSDFNGAAALSQEYTVSANKKHFKLIAYYAS
jgi:opacity protein-like surface antigen